MNTAGEKLILPFPFVVYLFLLVLLCIVDTKTCMRKRDIWYTKQILSPPGGIIHTTKSSLSVSIFKLLLTLFRASCLAPYLGQGGADMPPPSKSALERHLGTIHMFTGQFFKQNPNFGVKRLTKAISRVQVNNENGNPRD